MTVLMVTAGLIAILGYFTGSLQSVLAWRVPRDITVDRSVFSDMALPGRPTTGGVEVRPPLLELLTAGLYLGTTIRFGLSWSLPAYLWLCSAAVLLSVIDLRHQRLPNAVVGPFAIGAFALLILSSLCEQMVGSLVRGLIGAAALFLLYLLLALISPSSLGMGDVKLAGVLGLYLAYIGWRTLFLGALGAFALAAVVAAVLLIARRADRRTQIPFGPSMLIATLMAVTAV